MNATYEVRALLPVVFGVVNVTRIIGSGGFGRNAKTKRVTAVLGKPRNEKILHAEHFTAQTDGLNRVTVGVESTGLESEVASGILFCTGLPSLTLVYAGATILREVKRKYTAGQQQTWVFCFVLINQFASERRVEEYKGVSRLVHVVAKALLVGTWGRC